MNRIPRTATLAIAAVTSIAWVVAAALGLDQDAAVRMGFIPARLSGAALPVPAVPAFLTPLSATLVHGGALHLAFNMLMLVWCGTQVERVLGRTGLIGLYLVGAYAAAGAQWLSDPNGIVPM